MKSKYLFIGIAILVVGVGALLVSQSAEKKVAENEAPLLASPLPSPSVSHKREARVPAYQTAAETKQLGVTLAPAQFIGKAREAYQAAKEIPKTLAQLPCYCECDRGFGHKSLHSCFEDDHASHCAVCVDEALLAYKLQKEEKLTPEQVREKIIAQYSGGPGMGMH